LVPAAGLVCSWEDLLWLLGFGHCGCWLHCGCWFSATVAAGSRPLGLLVTSAGCWSAASRLKGQLRATSHLRLEARDHFTSSTLIGGKGGAGLD
jgi:hypothetical protein